MIKQILIIDDDPEDAEFFRDAVKVLSSNINVYHLDDGDKAIDYLVHCNKDEFPDVIFTDINMPTISGWECLRAIKQLVRYRDVPIVMFSTLNFKMQGLNPSDVGAAAFMTKPDSIKGLETNLHKLFSELFPGELFSVQ